MIAKIKFDKVQGASKEQLASFIYDAVSSWGGQYRPSDPLFRSLEVQNITIGDTTYENPIYKEED